jgi:inner membrane protein
MGEAAAGRKMGGKAAMWGAIAGTIPDLDVFIRSAIHPIDGALIHRGFSHSIVFALLASPLLAYLINKLYKNHYGFKPWLSLFFLAIITHPMLDIFTNYGTQFFWPFDVRLTFNSVFVIDPLYTLPFAIFLTIALFKRRESRWRKRLNYIGIALSCAYLVWSSSVKLWVLNKSPQYFEHAGINSKSNIVTPMPFTSFYWMMVGQDSTNFYVGYKSIFYDFDPNDINIIKKNHSYLDSLKWPNKDYTPTIKFITNDYYSVKRQKNIVKVYDLRFGLSTQATNGKISTPIKGYGMVIDSGYVDKTYGLRPNELWKHINFGAYWNKVFSSK